MKRPSALVLRTAGTNCDRETFNALSLSGFDCSVKHINKLLSEKAPLSDYRLIAIPGGFSYGDDISAGKVFANELISKLGEELRQFVRRGNMIIGICNGFQVLVKTGLLPGFSDADEPFEQSVTLMTNDSNRYEDRWIRLSCNPALSKFVTEGEVISLPVAHAEGKFVTGDKKILDRIIAQGQVVFRYVDENGEQAGYPGNPNGSEYGIAGICDESGQVLGMMPHPERFWNPLNHPGRTRMSELPVPEGLKLFKNAFNYASKMN